MVMQDCQSKSGNALPESAAGDAYRHYGLHAVSRNAALLLRVPAQRKAAETMSIILTDEQNQLWLEAHEKYVMDQASIQEELR